jgi:CheY-like chemotaxis protein
MKYPYFDTDSNSSITLSPEMDPIEEFSEFCMEDQKPHKKVQFSTSLRAHLIMTRQEFLSCGILSALYWTEAELAEMKANAIEEVSDFIKKQGVTKAEAYKILYQPESMLFSRDLYTDSIVGIASDFLSSSANDSLLSPKTDVELLHERFKVVSESTISLTNQDISSSSKLIQVEWRKPKAIKVLVTDDSPLCLKIISSILRKVDHEVVAAKSSALAISIIENDPKKFDVLIIDLIMPELDGSDLIRRIRSDLHIDTPVIVLTSLDLSHPLSKKSIENGGNLLLNKPVHPVLLLRAMANLVSRDEDELY